MVAGALASRAWLQPMSLHPSASHTSSYSCATQYFFYQTSHESTMETCLCLGML